MSTPIVMPEAGESVLSGVLTAWTKDEGAWVERDETVAEIETDKITVEVMAPEAGVLSRSAAEGEEIDVGATIGAVDGSAAKPAGSAKSESKPAAASANGAPAAAAGGATAVVAPPPPAETKQPKPAGTVEHAAPGQNGSARATPLAKKLAEDHKVDLGKVHGTGVGGRVREQDVVAFMQSGGPAPAMAPAPTSAAGSRSVTLERMSPLRQKIASRLVEAQQTAAMLTTFNECDMGALMDMRKKHKEAFTDKHGIGLGFMSFFVKAVVGALQQFPKVNSYIVADDAGKPAMQGHGYQDVAIAVSSPKGLVVPVIRNAEALTFAGIEKTIKDFGMRAKDGKLGLDEMTGGTFTITNGGVFGSLLSTPILNPPQSAILGMHGIKKRAVEYPEGSGQIALRPMMYLALSYDHRIVDGAEAVQFLVAVKDSIEDPARLMLEL
ncbi:MAG: dihydrolipoyllysine-residue succinyltransferase component of 2-oxoglutarate dehydrogenase complex [Phycisphaeraceae bacterium]|nr:MAG: dihydrolipoyllysine-residue succinyltransferase component of 2-oxoglutarate dehydrogenase complex [Phycisphaeraceae bacterium]